MVSTHVEKVKAGSGMITRLLECQVEQSAVDSLFGVETRVCLELEALCELILDLELGAENVGRCPGVCKDGSVLVISVFGLEVPGNVTVFRVTRSSNTERHIGWCLRLHFEPDGMEWIVPTEKVRGAFSEILLLLSSFLATWEAMGESKSSATTLRTTIKYTNLPGRWYRLRQRHVVGSGWEQVDSPTFDNCGYEARTGRC